MALLDKFEDLGATRAALTATGVDPTAMVIEDILSPTEAVIDGRRMLLAGTNNYLGMTFEAECISAARSALEQAGTGTTGSRMANGSYVEHLKLEQELAAFYQVPHGMVFSTGYSANLGVLAALAGPGDVMLLDGDCHASLYDGARLSGAAVYRFAHNDPASLDTRLRRLGDQAQGALVVVEGIYSMLGDHAPLADIVELKQRYGTYLMIDEAHSLGVLGQHGRGLAEAAGLSAEMDFIVGTFSKSLGATGGFCVSPHRQLELFRYASRPYIFTASPCPSVIASVRAALVKLRDGADRRRRLAAYAEKLYRALQDQGWRLGPDVSPVLAVRMDNPEQAIALWRGLLAAAIYTNLVLPPAAPEGGSLLRVSLSSAHTDSQLGYLIEAFADLRANLTPATTG